MFDDSLGDSLMSLSILRESEVFWQVGLFELLISLKTKWRFFGISPTSGGYL